MLKNYLQRRLIYVTGLITLINRLAGVTMAIYNVVEFIQSTLKKTRRISFSEDSFTFLYFILCQSGCRILSSIHAFCKQPLGNFSFLKLQKLCKTKHGIIKLGRSLTFTSIALLKQRNLPFSRPNAFSITILGLDNL